MSKKGRLGRGGRGLPARAGCPRTGAGEKPMMPKLLAGITSVAMAAAMGGWGHPEPVETLALSGYKVLAPIRHGNLTVFPVVAVKTHNTEEFLTLDEGLRSGDVVVTESGVIRPMVRRPNMRPYNPGGGAEVNRLVLVNNSKRPLLLLAGEIVTGGKQDRVIGKDRLVPAESDPIDLSVFCVEPGRWVGKSMKFGAMQGAMAAPAVRGSAMGYNDQAKVWSEVRKAQTLAAARVPAASPQAAELQSTTSYASVMQNKEVQTQVDA